MKPILYGEHEKEFNTNGIGILSDAIDCNVDQALNGSYELELIYPARGIHFNSIVQRGIILAKPDPVTRPQPFRIYRITKPMNGKVTVYARHVAYDMAGIPVAPFTASSAPAALQGMKDNAVTECPFTFWTDKTTAAAMTVAVPRTIWNLLGGSQGSILDTYGGEYEFDRWEVKLYNSRGADRGVSIRYGKNLTSLEQDENIANCYTGIYPYWTNAEGTLVQLTEKTVSAEGTFSYVRTKTVDFSAEWMEAPTQEQLRARAERYIRENNIGKPAVSWKVEFVALEQTEEYKGTEILERIQLGDTVTVVLPELNIDVSARAVAARYKPLLDRYAYVTLGSVKANIASTIAQQQQEIYRKPSVSLVQSVVMTLTATILGAKGGAVRLLDTDGDEMPDTLYVADNADPALAVKVWRWNYEGWAGSKTGYNGPFILGATLEDGLLAEAVTAAKLIAGTIQSKDGKTFYLDLDNGILRMQATEFSVSGKTVEQIAEGKAGEAVKAQTQEDIFNKWTGNGSIQGIYSENGVWVINAAVAKVLSLIADHVISKDASSSLEIEGGKLMLKINGETCMECYASGSPILYLKDLGEIYAGNQTELTGHHLKIGGTSANPLFHVVISDGKSEINADSFYPTGSGNCKWEYISSIDRTVLVQA